MKFRIRSYMMLRTKRKHSFYNLIKAQDEESQIQIVNITKNKKHTEKRKRCRNYLKKQKLFFESGVTKFTQVYATRNKEGKTAADCLCDDFMPHFGIPGKVLHDQGKEFDNDLLKQLAQLYNIKRLRTSPYHPQTNSQTGRIN